MAKSRTSRGMKQQNNLWDTMVGSALTSVLAELRWDVLKSQPIGCHRLHPEGWIGPPARTAQLGRREIRSRGVSLDGGEDEHEVCLQAELRWRLCQQHGVLHRDVMGCVMSVCQV